MEISRTCLNCSQNEHLAHRFPCGKTYCRKCIVKWNYARLKVFETKLLNDLEALKNQASYISCLEDCGECRVSMSVETLQSFLPDSNLNEEEKRNFMRLSTIGKSYFSGIKINFYNCLNCNEYITYVKAIQFICKNCIINMLRDRISFIATGIKIVWWNTLESISESHWMGQNFHLVCFDRGNQTYYHQPHVDENGDPCHKISKLWTIDKNQEFMIVRALEMHSDDNYLVIDNHVQDVKLICVAVPL